MTVVQFIDGDRSTGFGVQLDTGEILTAAHVLNRAAGADWDSAATRLRERFTLRFPLAGGDANYEAEVKRWLPPKDRSGDIATLELIGRAPQEGRLLDPLVDLKAGVKIHVWGPSASDPAGEFATGELVAAGRGAWWQINQAQDGTPRISAGFSGSPVFDSEERLLGILWGGIEGAGRALMIPADLLDERRFVFSSERGTANWRMNYVFDELLSALFDDLVLLERRGLDDETECPVVAHALAQMSNVLSELDGNTGWTKPPHEIAEGLEGTYRQWNDWKFGPEGALHRNASVRTLRNDRRDLKTGTRNYLTKLYQDRLPSAADRIVENFKLVIAIKDEEARTRFPRLSRAINQYYLRGGGPIGARVRTR